MKLHLRAMAMSYGHTLPATRHKWTQDTQLETGGRYSIYLPGEMEGWVDLGDRLHTETVYPHTDGHPSKY